MSKMARKKRRKEENEALAKEARFWSKAPKSALSVEDHRIPINRQASDVFKKAKKRRKSKKTASVTAT